jgi:hypothetical protein
MANIRISEAGVSHDVYQPTQGSARTSLTSNGVGNRYRRKYQPFVTLYIYVSTEIAI